MDNGTLIVCFDINSTREENQKKPDNTEELMENPNGIFNNFFAIHKMDKMEQKKISDSEINYKFYLNLQKKSMFQIRTISDLSFIHEISLNADSYIIFINLEDPQTKEKIEYLIRYILDSCSSVDIKTYIVGIYKDKDRIFEENKKVHLENLFSEDNLNYEYFQINYNNDDKNHFCFYDYIGNKDYGDKRFFKKKIEEYKLVEILEKIISQTYEEKEGVYFDPLKKKFITKPLKSSGDSSCNIL